MLKKNTIIVPAICALMIFIVSGVYALWYSHNRQLKIAQVEKCNYEMEHPKPLTMMTAPDGNLAPVYTLEICPVAVVPPSLQNLLRGRIVFEGVPNRMEVNAYSLKDILLGNYTLGPEAVLPCDQSATTTPCATLDNLQAQ